MATNLIAQLTNDFGGDALSRVASALGENTVKTESAIAAVVPALFAALANKVTTASGANDLLDLIRRNKLDSGQLGDVGSALKTPDGITSLTNTGRSLMDFTTNGRSSAIADWVSSSVGIRRSSATSLIAMVLPLVLGRISRFAGGAGLLTASGLQSLLVEQTTFLKNAPFGLPSVLGIGDTRRGTMVGATEPSRQPAVAAYSRPETPGTPWWIWAIPILLLLALVPFLMRRSMPDAGTATARDPQLIATSGRALGDFIDRRLPNGTTLRIPSLGVENKLISYIADTGALPDKETWFSFDRLEFETDSALIKPSSREQLQNVAAILRAYPQANAKLGGYTDNVGDKAYNMKLSSDRATNTMNEIVGMGVDRSRLEAEGYGENHPIADNSTPEGRQRNRRIDIRVTKR